MNLRNAIDTHSNDRPLSHHLRRPRRGRHWIRPQTSAGDVAATANAANIAIRNT